MFDVRRRMVGVQLLTDATVLNQTLLLRWSAVARVPFAATQHRPSSSSDRHPSKVPYVIRVHQSSQPRTSSRCSLVRGARLWSPVEDRLSKKDKRRQSGGPRQ